MQIQRLRSRERRPRHTLHSGGLRAQIGDANLRHDLQPHPVSSTILQIPSPLESPALRPRYYIPTTPLHPPLPLSSSRERFLILATSCVSHNRIICCPLQNPLSL